MDPLNTDAHLVCQYLCFRSVQLDLVEYFPVTGIRTFHQLLDGLDLNPVKGLLLNIRPAMLLETVLLAAIIARLVERIGVEEGNKITIKKGIPVRELQEGYPACCLRFDFGVL